MENRVREIRLKRGLKQRELAERVGIHQSNLSDLENGRYNPGMRLAFRLSDALDVGVRELFASEYFTRTQRRRRRATESTEESHGGQGTEEAARSCRKPVEITNGPEGR